ncbi:MAG: sensor histidine kinase [Chitinophagaceae bacterium]|nr:sensor histidine kinase [Chitinophagaceae bacterium]
MNAYEARVLIAVAISTFLIALIVTVLVILLFIQHRKNLLLQQKTSMGEIASLEFERARIAADLHDDLGPLLAAIKFRVGLLSPSSSEDQEEIKQSVDHLDEAIQRLRKISNNLLPTALERKGLVDAVYELINQAMRVKNITIEFEYDTFPALSKDYEVHFYRIIQESLSNCLKHANATNLRIALTSKDNVINLQIIDNGKGLPANFSLEGISGRGLIGLKNRASIMGGELLIHSHPEKGTILEFEIPIHA